MDFQEAIKNSYRMILSNKSGLFDNAGKNYYWDNGIIVLFL
jgi:hypothetical protein